jgi:hypothetical protein
VLNGIWYCLPCQRIQQLELKEPFYVHNGSNGPSHITKPTRTSRVAVRKQLHRIREIMAEFFAANVIDLNPWTIIRSEPTSTREVRYRVDAVVSTDHPDWRGVTW